MFRADETIARAIFGDAPRVWDAYQQGQYARATGQPLSANPWPHPALGFHVNERDWARGWRAGVNLEGSRRA
jgi:hypothetical protein